MYKKKSNTPNSHEPCVERVTAFRAVNSSRTLPTFYPSVVLRVRSTCFVHIHTPWARGQP